MKNYVLALAAILMLGGCSYAAQTTSGKDYLARHGMQAANAQANAGATAANFDQQLVSAANVEPTLTFPARIGLARIEAGHLSAVPGEEAELWIKAKQGLGSDFGEFVPLSPLVASMVSSEVNSGNRVENVMKQIRLGAARQHLDAVLVYETYSSVDKDSNLLAIADLTIIGGFILPAHQIKTEGYGDAMLIDVMSGYPYGTIETSIPKDEKAASAWGWGSDEDKMSEQIKLKVTEKLVTEAEEMFKRVRMELAEKRAAKN